MSLRSVKRLKRANRCILRQWKSWEKVLVLWFIHILKTVNLKLLKGMLSSKLGMWKGYHLPMEGIRNGEFFCHKRYIKGSGVKPGGRASPYNTFLVPPGRCELLTKPKERASAWQANVFPVVALLRYPRKVTRDDRKYVCVQSLVQMKPLPLWPSFLA